MTVRYLYTGQLQYQKVEEAIGAGQWFQTWWNQHYASIRPAGSGYSVSALIPAVVMEGDPGPANGQLSWNMHMEDVDLDTITGITNVISAALGDGGVYQSIGESGTSLTQE